MSITRRGLVGAVTAVTLLTGNLAYAAEGATKRIMVYGDSNTWGYIQGSRMSLVCDDLEPVAVVPGGFFAPAA